MPDSRSRLEAVGLDRLARTDSALKVALCGALLVVVGIFGPFSTDGLDPYTGIASDEGKLMLFSAVVALVVLFIAAGTKGGPELLLAALSGVVILIDGIRVLRSVLNEDDDLRDDLFGELPGGYITPSPGWGLWVLLAGAVVLIVGCLASLYARSSART